MCYNREYKINGGDKYADKSYRYSSGNRDTQQ